MYRDYQTNKPWTPTNRWKYNFMMDAVFNQAKTIYSSTPSDPQCKYQPGGNLLPTTQAATKWDDLLGPQQKVNGTRESS